ncbi:hypothetical protein DITRI_Ditri16bG0126800 [Diplodiscus trichospermus]
MENVALRSSSTQAKILGTIVSISGALVVVFYKGPEVFSSSSWTSSSSSSSSVLLQWLLESLPESNWVIGGVLITVAKILASVWFIIQTQVMEIYPQELTASLFYTLCVTCIALPVSLIAESSLSSWRLTPSIAVVTVLYSGVMLAVRCSVYTWGVHLKGPVYVVIFKPLSIAIAAFMSAIFLGDALHLGSAIGAIILSIGFYAVIWGKAKEEKRIDDDKAPLLQSNNVEEI